MNHTYGGEIDALPTILNLLGVKDNDTVQFGSDLLSADHPQTVAFRNGDFVTPDFTKVGSQYFNTTTGKKIDKLSESQKESVDASTNRVTTELSLSDRVINGDLLRFYTPAGFKKVDRSDFSYKLTDTKKKLKAAQKKGTSLKAENKGKSVADEYKTDAPELKDDSDSSSSESK